MEARRVSGRAELHGKRILTHTFAEAPGKKCRMIRAHDVGFQSPAQFNRTFKRIFGQSPTEFRAHLHTVRARAKRHEPVI
jgi:hypothetical protein